MKTRRELLTGMGASFLFMTTGCSAICGRDTLNSVDLLVHNNLNNNPVTVTVQLLRHETELFRQHVTLKPGPNSASESFNAVNQLEEKAELTVKVSLNSPSKNVSKTIAVGCLPGGKNTEVIVQIEPEKHIVISSSGCDR